MKMGQFSFMMLMLGLLFNGLVVCNCGITGTYVRKTEASIDMPFESDVFASPQGYNAPQQENANGWKDLKDLTQDLSIHVHFPAISDSHYWKLSQENGHGYGWSPLTICQIAIEVKVHITQGDLEGKSVIVSWVTPTEPGTNTVMYGTVDNKTEFRADGIVTTYKFYNYTSPYLHHCRIKNLKYGTEYFYEVGIGNTTRQFSFTTPPPVGPDVPYNFGIIGDLGQTFDSNSTLEHYLSNPKGQAVLFVGDLSYADDHPFHDNARWDSWGRFVERSTAYQPWIWTAGNHEIDFVPEIGETVPFKPYKHRYFVPYRASNSTSPLWYSIKRASAYVIVLSSYSAYGKYTPQYEWLEKEFLKVNRNETPWLIVLMHTPWYNSLNYHYMEGESMRVMFEPWFVKYKVDVVFAGHVHSYERSERISNIAYNITNGQCKPVVDQSAPIYITIGDGGNIEGIANSFTEPQPNYSAYREASFGHATLEINNRTHALYSWHRNRDGVADFGDSLWFYNRHWHPQPENNAATMA